MSTPFNAHTSIHFLANLNIPTLFTEALLFVFPPVDSNFPGGVKGSLDRHNHRQKGHVKKDE